MEERRGRGGGWQTRQWQQHQLLLMYRHVWMRGAAWMRCFVNWHEQLFTFLSLSLSCCRIRLRLSRSSISQPTFIYTIWHVQYTLYLTFESNRVIYIYVIVSHTKNYSWILDEKKMVINNCVNGSAQLHSSVHFNQDPNLCLLIEKDCRRLGIMHGMMTPMWAWNIHTFLIIIINNQKEHKFCVRRRIDRSGYSRADLFCLHFNMHTQI